MKSKPWMLTGLDVLSAVMILIAAWLVLSFAPVEVQMGAVQKVFYFHVAAAWVGMLGFLVAAVAGVFYLRRNEQRWDIIGVSAVEISLVFFLTAIIMGSIWARPIWNTWWTWDPRLTTAAIVELIYAAYMLLRSGVDDPDRRARLSAIYAIMGFVSVPLTFISIRLLRTIHPVVIGSAEAASLGGFNMDAPMRTAFFFSLVAFSVLFADLLWHRIRLGELRSAVDSLRMQAFQEEN